MITQSRRTSITSQVLILLAAAAAISMTLLMSAEPAYAEGDLAFDSDYIDVDAELPYGKGRIELTPKEGVSEKIIKVVPEDESIVVAMKEDVGMPFMLYPMSVGTTTVNVTGWDGTEVALTVYVSSSAFKRVLDYWSNADDLMYGHSAFRVYSLPGVKVSVKVGKDKYNAFKIPQAEEIYVDKDLKANKRVYNLGTKITVTYSKSGVKVVKYFTVKTHTDVTYASAKGKKLKLGCWDVHKGDKVKVKVGGRTYVKKVGKNYSYKDFYCVIKTRKSIKQNATFKVVVKNKYKKTLKSRTITLSGGSWDINDEPLAGE